MAESTIVRVAPALSPIPLCAHEIRIDDADSGVSLVTLAPAVDGCIQTNEDGSISFRLAPQAAGNLIKALLPHADVRPLSIVVVYGEKIDVRLVDK